MKQKQLPMMLLMMPMIMHSRRRLLAGLCGACGIIAAGLLAGCERFRHETYTCPYNAVGLHELIINDDKAGADLTVIEIEDEYSIPIGSITEDQMIASNEEMVLMLNRKTGRLNVTIGNRSVFMTCEKTIFTM